MANETIFAEGIRTFGRNEKAPDFVLGSIVITLEDFKAWVNSNQQYLTDYNGKKQIKLQVLKKKDGNGITVIVDNFKPTPKTMEQKIEPLMQQFDGVVEDNSGLPF